VSDTREYRWDLWLIGALLVAAILRIGPAILFEQMACVRDECIYRSMAAKIVAGEGLTVSSKGWLTAPGYPYLLALMRTTTGGFFTVKVVNIALALINVGTVYEIAKRVADLKTARVAVWLFAMHPTLAFFTQTMWIETIYIFFLLNAALAVLWARDKPWPYAGAAGLMLACCILFRGVATYLPPIFLVALIWPDAGWTHGAALLDSVRRRWKHGAAMVLATAIAVAPYSMYASSKHGGFVVSDATVGHVMFLGNNDYPPLTFDYGIGMLTSGIYRDYLQTGRRPCNRLAPPVQSSKCEVKASVNWMTENPEKFARRVPVRLAQLFNPNSFLTRHIRWGYWSGYPWLFKELTAAYIAAMSFFIVLFGTTTAFARARGPYAFIAVGTVLYTIAISGLTYGMTRFRLPLEPLWIIYVAMFLADPRATLAALRGSTPRAVGALLAIPPLTMLMLWYLPTGFPRFW